MRRFNAVAFAVADELTKHAAMIDGHNPPNVITLTVKLGPQGAPYAVQLKSEWDRRIGRRLTPGGPPA